MPLVRGASLTHQLDKTIPRRHRFEFAAREGSATRRKPAAY
jgi:hypothetical protein